MYPETKPIVTKLSPEFDTIEIYPIHDLHYGNECFDMHRWNVLRDEIMAQDNRYVVWVGDLMENALPGSKSNPLTQLHSPLEQREFVTEQFKLFKDRTLGIVDGNHEYNRSTRFAGMYPLYDAACIAGIEDKYRATYAVIDIMFGSGRGGHREDAYQYVGFAIHKAKDLKSFHSADVLEGFDFFLFGHDHDPREHARGKIRYIRQNHALMFGQVETVNCGSFLTYGGYGAMAGYRPVAPKMYKLICHGERKYDNRIETVGFYLE